VKKTVIALALIASLCCCDKYEQMVLHNVEPGEVVDTLFIPAGHGTGSGWGMSTSGSMVFTENSIRVPARYGVVFRCEHGQFASQGQDERHKQLWEKLPKGSVVRIQYDVIQHLRNGQLYKEEMDFIDAEVSR